MLTSLTLDEVFRDIGVLLNRLMMDGSKEQMLGSFRQKVECRL
jgi:hypothetical protein